MEEKLDQVLSILKAQDEKFTKKFEEVDARLNAMDEKFTKKFEEVDARFNSVDERFDLVDARFNAMDRKFTKRFEEVEEQRKIDSNNIAAILNMQTKMMQMLKENRSDNLIRLPKRRI